jgi:hypothetical protein
MRGVYTFCLLAGVAVGKRLHALSFLPPFNDHVDDWLLSRDARANAGNLQLAQDVPSQTGAAWSRGSGNMNEMGLIVEGILKSADHSGAGSEFGVFVVRNTGWVEGSSAIAGTSENFMGLAVTMVPDTSCGEGQGCRQLKLWLNHDGRRELRQMANEKRGCTSLRLEKNNQFKIRIMMYQSVVFLLWWDYGSNTWQECETVATEFTEDVLQNSHVGISQRSGTKLAGAEGIRIVSLDVNNRWDAATGSPKEMVPQRHKSESEAERIAQMTAETAQYAAAKGAQNEGSDSSATQKFNEQLAKKMQMHEWAMEKRIERLTGIVDNLLTGLDKTEREFTKSAHGKINDKLQVLEQSARSRLMQRLDEIEAKMKKQVHDSLEPRLAELDLKMLQLVDTEAMASLKMLKSGQGKLADKLEVKFDQIQDKFHEKLKVQASAHVGEIVDGQQQTMQSWVGQVTKKLTTRSDEQQMKLHAAAMRKLDRDGGKWMAPFAGASVLLLGIGSVVRKNFLKEQKNHLL